MPTFSSIFQLGLSFFPSIWHKVIFSPRLEMQNICIHRNSQIASHGPSEFRMAFFPSRLNVIYSINTRTNKKKLKKEMFFLCKITQLLFTGRETYFERYIEFALVLDWLVCRNPVKRERIVWPYIVRITA